MTVINTNVGALNARVAALGAQSGMEKAMQRLSSGLRINQAADDAAGLAVATKMESQLRGINMAIRNSNDGISSFKQPSLGWEKFQTWLSGCVNFQCRWLTASIVMVTAQMRS